MIVRGGSMTKRKRGLRTRTKTWRKEVEIDDGRRWSSFDSYCCNVCEEK
jgi:hypothetical protein